MARGLLDICLPGGPRASPCSDEHSSTTRRLMALDERSIFGSEGVVVGPVQGRHDLDSSDAMPCRPTESRQGDR